MICITVYEGDLVYGGNIRGIGCKEVIQGVYGI